MFKFLFIWNCPKTKKKVFKKINFKSKEDALTYAKWVHSHIGILMEVKDNEYV